MKKILLRIAAVVGVLIVGVLIAATMQPSEYTVTRSRVISAAPATIFPYLNDMQKWQTWNPWARMDSTVQYTYSSPASGVGAWYEWRGQKMGRGRMEVTGASEQQVTYALAFHEPFESNSRVTMALSAQASNRTELRWSMSGENNFVGKIMSLFCDMDAMIGKDFADGLNNLEAVVTARPNG